MYVFDFLSNVDISGSNIVLDELLPLVHTTVYQDFKKGTFPAINILEQKKLEKRFNKEHLLYFFYGRPAFRFKDEMEIPVVFIIEPILKDINKVYPFDSGAFNNLYIDNYRLDSRTPISDYELLNNFLAIRQYINAIFGSNHNYYYGKRKIDDKLPDSVKQCRKINQDLNNLLNLIVEKKQDGIDDRRKTVEIQSANDYNLSGKLVAVFAPSYCFNESVFININASGVKLYNLKYYNMSKARIPIPDLLKCIERYYVDKKYIMPGDNYED